jgi:VCBS repeat-containing protein
MLKKHRPRAIQRLRRQRHLVFESLEDRRVLASIVGQVVCDFDGDAILEEHEPGLSGWQIYADNNNNEQFDDGEPTALTDANGEYELADLSVGFYTLRRVPQAGWQQTYPAGVGKHTVNIRNSTQEVLGVDFAQQRLFTPFVPGNLLITRSSFLDNDLLMEYTPDGQLVQALVIPGSEDQSRLIAKDLVLDRQGNVQIFNGYDDVRLTTFDSITATFSDTLVPGWDMGQTFDQWGDIAAFGPYVFANEQLADGGTANGVIRFDSRDLSYQRFSGGFGLPTDLTVGLDGLLYTLNATVNNTTILVHQPESMSLVRALNVPQRLQSIAVDRNGDLYAVTDTGLKHYQSDGTPVPITTVVNGLDIALSHDNRLVVTSDVRVTLLDVALLDAADGNDAILASFPILGSVAENFLSFAAFVQAPVGDGQTGGGIDYGILQPGNILVANSPRTGGVPQLYEYTAFGQLVRQHDLPMHETGGARDLVTDAQGNVRVFNGTFAPRLTTYDSQAADFVADDLQFAGWSTADVPTWGGIASYRNYLYATDTKTQDDARTERGIVRYNLATETFERFHGQHGDLIDLNIGLDGLLYTLGPADKPIGTVVRQYHPVTMELLQTIALPANHRAIAIDANGDIFAANPDIQRYTVDGNTNTGVPAGEPLSDRGLGELGDIDIDADGRLLAAATNGQVLLTDRAFTAVYSFLTRASDGMNFAAFVSPTRPLPSARWDSFTVEQASTDNELDVLANDSASSLGVVSITAVGLPSAGGSVTIAGDVLASYTPAQNPDFVGTETFTYTLGDGLGGTDQGLVQVTVEGSGNYFAFDDGYSTLEDDLLPLNVPAGAGVLVNDGQPDIFPVLTPGNLLVTHSPTGSSGFSLLQEYTPAGVLVRSIELPSYTGASADVRDLVLDRQGNVRIFNGTSQPRLTTYDPVAETLTQTAFDKWNTAEEKSGGGLAAWKNFVYAPDQLLSGENPLTDAGIVRFDVEAGTAQRFIDDGNFIDLTVGRDGLLYALGPAGAATSRFIRVYNPQSMVRVREIPNMPADLRAITVAANGDIYGVRNSPNTVVNLFVYRYAGNGAPSALYPVQLPGGTLPAAEADFNDIDLSEDGRTLLIANVNQSNTAAFGDGDVVLFSLQTLTATILQAPDASSDMKFAAWVQAPVATVNGPLTVVSFTQPAHGTFDCDPSDPLLDGVETDGSFCYVPDPDFSGRDGFSYVVSDADGKLREAFVSLTVLPENDPPVLTPADPPQQIDSDEDAVLTIPLTTLLNGGPGTTTVTDADRNDPTGGIAVTQLTGAGVWSFSLDGSVFVDIGLVAGDNALHLPYSADIRFTPSGGGGGGASFTYLAWDQTVGTAGNKSPATWEIAECLAGGLPDPDTLLCPDGTPPVEMTYVTSTAYSQDENRQPVTDTLNIALLDLPDAPVLIPSTPQMGTTDEHTAFEAAFDQFVTGVSDPDGSNVLQGVVLISAAGQGTWEYSLDGSLYLPLPALTAEQSLVLDAADRLRYTPDNLNGEIATVTYRAWDKSDGAAAGDLVDASRFGGATAYSAATDTGWVEVTDINDAPVLTPQSPVIGTTDVVTPLEATLSDFVRGITDADRNAVVGGIAVTGVMGQGTWSYSLDGTTFQNVPLVTSTAALLLDRGDILRYTPAGGLPETATITYRAWDASQGTAGGVADVTTGGGDTAFSIAGDLAAVTVEEVNVPPTIGNVGGPLVYVENAPPQAVFPSATVVDPNSADFDGGTLVATILSGGTPSDGLLIREGNGISLAGDTVIYDSGGPRLIGSYTVDGWMLTVQLTSAEATLAAVQALVRSIAYENVSDNPTSSDRRILLSLSDGDGGNDLGDATQTVTIQPVNDPPLAQSEEYVIFTDQLLVVSRTNGVLANDSDPEGTTLTAALVETPLEGDLTWNSDGSFAYQPRALFYGRDAFTYKASDGQAFSPDIRVAIEVRLRPTNPANPADVNADGFLSPVDSVLIANYLLGNGAGPLPAGYDPPPFVDYNGDGSATQEDVDSTAADIDNGGARPVPPPALMIPQTPSSPGPGELVRVTLKTTDAAGAVIASINAGQPFYLEAWVADQRVSPLGVAAAYLDVTYPNTLASVAGAVAGGTEFPHFVAGQTAMAGLIDEAGAGRTTVLADGQEHRLWQIPLVAVARGPAVFAANPADQSPSGDFLLFGLDGPLDRSANVVYTGTTLQIKGPPLATDDEYRVDEDGELTVSAAAGVLDNDFDEEGDPLSAVLVSPPASGTLQFTADGSFTYRPAPDFSGTDQFTYRANDGFFDSNTATVTITVTGFNDAPVAADDSYSVFRNQTLNVPAAQGVLGNDFDADGDSPTVQLIQSPAHGVVVLRTDGSFDYTPATDYGGPDSFTYKLSDSVAESNEATVRIEVFFDWQNPYHPVDINGDGYASPLDALLVFNDVRLNGVRVLPDPPVPPDVAPPFFDLNGDGKVSDFDGNKVLEDLNANGSRQLPEPRVELPQPVPPLADGPLVRLRLQAVNAAGQPVSSVNEGETFFLNVYAADLRPSGQGVFSAYLDVAYDAAALTAAGPVQFGASFPNVRAGGATTPGGLDEIGAVGASTPDGLSDPLLATVQFTTTAPGQYALQANPADVLPAGQVTLWGIDGPIPPDKIEYGTANITVVREDGDGDGATDSEEDGAPNAGDANRDGTADRLQNRVASVRNLAGNLYATFSAASPVVLSDTTAVANPEPGSTPANIQFPLGFFQWNVGGLAAGEATTVTVLLQPGAVANAYYRYGPTPDNASPHWYPFMFDGVTGAIIHSDRIEVRLVEGQRGDDNLAGAGLAFGPGGPALSNTPWVNPRNSLDANNSGDVTALDVLTLINEINRTGARALPPVPATGETLPPYLDTNGDNLLEAADVLNIVNWLNSAVAGEGEGAVADRGLQDVAGLAVGALPAERSFTPAESDLLSPSRAANGAVGTGRPDTSARTSSASRAADSADNPRRLRPSASSSPTSMEESDLELVLEEISPDVAWEWDRS